MHIALCFHSRETSKQVVAYPEKVTSICKQYPAGISSLYSASATHRTTSRVDGQISQWPDLWPLTALVRLPQSYRLARPCIQRERFVFLCLIKAILAHVDCQPTVRIQSYGNFELTIMNVPMPLTALRIISSIPDVPLSHGVYFCPCQSKPK